MIRFTKEPNVTWPMELFRNQKLGLVTEAHGGVLFIDEIGELEPMLQK